MQEKNTNESAWKGQKCGRVSEILTIQIWINLRGCKNLKAFYNGVNGEFLRSFLGSLF
jgi:hypothetical protein